MKFRIGSAPSRLGGLVLACLLTLTACDSNDDTPSDPDPTPIDRGALVGIWDIEIIADPCRSGPVIVINDKYTRCSSDDSINLNDLLPFDYFEDCQLSSEGSPFTLDCSGVSVEVGGCVITGEATITFVTNDENTEATGTGSFTITVDGDDCEQESLCYDLDATATRLADPPTPCTPGTPPPPTSP